MSLYTKACLVVFGYFFSSIIVFNTCVCKKQEGYKFPVYSTEFCPGNESEWNKRSSALNCNKTNGYTCLPNENFTELIEFCYKAPFIWIQEGVCLYLKRKGSYVDAYSCSHFIDGCHNTSYQSRRIFDYPACITIGNGCFLAEQSCKSSPNTTHQSETSGVYKDVFLWVMIVMCIIAVVCFSSGMIYIYRKRKFSSCKRGNAIKNSIEFEERKILITDTEHVKNDFSTELSDYKCNSANNLHDFEEKVSFTANVGTDTGFSDEEFSSCTRGNTIKNTIEFEERKILITDTEHVKNDFSTEPYKCNGANSLDDFEEKVSFTANVGTDTGFSDEESTIEKAIFNEWKKDDLCFITTKALKQVEKNIKSRNLLIVAGHSGSGKSAIIQHIALKYREQGWTVKRVKNVKHIIKEYSSSRFQKNKTICVFNDPFGKESFDEILNNSWHTYEEELNLYLKTAKLIMSCRNHIISDTRLTRFFVYQSHIIDIDDNKNKLTVDEKRQILRTYKIDVNLPDKDCDKIVEVEKYFPLLCKLYSVQEDNKNTGIGFFTEPVTMLKEEIIGFRTKDKGKYCALALLVLFNDNLCVNDLLENKDKENKFKHTLKLCGLPENIPPSAIRDNLNSLNGFFVKTIGDTYHFYHDFVMEVTTYVFGTDYPKETITYADIGFLRKRVRLEDVDKHDDSFTIYLSDRYVQELGERLYTELFRECLLDVVLNPCLRNKKLIKVLGEKIADHPENLHMFFEKKKLSINKQELDQSSKNILLTKPFFLNFENEVSPLFYLMVFCHTQLSKRCLHSLKQIDNFVLRFVFPNVWNNSSELLYKQIYYKLMQFNYRSYYIPAVCCNGSTELFNDLNDFKDKPNNLLYKETWGGLFSIHIVSVFHNYQILSEMITMGVDVNLKTKGKGGWTSLILAAGNDTQEHGDYYQRESGAERRDKTVQLLLSNGANINLCMENKGSPLYIACQNGHDSTVQLLLSYGADINLCQEDGASPLHIACQNGHDRTVQLLLSYGADINLCREDGASPLHIACQNGHDRTVQVLLRNRADINLCTKDEVSPLHIACQNGQDSTVKLLLSNEADINLCKKNGASPLYIACFNGHDSTVQLLLSNGADINLCTKDGASPLYSTCQNGLDSIVQLLLGKGAVINLCAKDGASPLHIACLKGHDSTVQLLLDKGAIINLSMENKASPLYIACQYGHDSTVQLLLGKGADINLCKEDGASPLHTACQNGHDRIVQLLLSKGADINLCREDGASPLHLACQSGNDVSVKQLLDHGSDINLCSKDDVSPLYVAFAWRQYKTVNILLKRNADTSLSSGLNPTYLDLFDRNDSTIVFLQRKDNIYNNIYDPDSYFSLFVFCHVERLSRALFVIHS